MNIGVIGGVKSGKTEVAAALARLVAEARAFLAVGGSSGGSKRGARARKAEVQKALTCRALLVPGCIVTNRNGGVAAAEWGFEVKRTRTLGGTGRAMEYFAGRPVLLEDCTSLYEQGLKTWREISNSYRLANGLTPLGRMGPEAWAVINEYYRSAVTFAADRHRVDPIEVHRLGQDFILSPDYGLVPVDGVRPRGQAESGSGSDLLLQVVGGLRSKSRPSNERTLVVLADPSRKAKGQTRELPDLRSGREALLAELRALLWDSLLDLIPKTDAEREAWLAVEEVPDDFPEAREGAERDELAILKEAIRVQLLRFHFAGPGEEERIARADALSTAFGVTSVELLDQVPTEVVKKGFRKFELVLGDLDALRAQRSQIVAALSAEIQARGLDRQTNDAKGTRRRLLVEVCGVEDISLLGTVPLEKLKGAPARLAELAEGLNWQVLPISQGKGANPGEGS